MMRLKQPVHSVQVMNKSNLLCIAYNREHLHTYTLLWNLYYTICENKRKYKKIYYRSSEVKKYVVEVDNVIFGFLVRLDGRSALFFF